MTVFTLRNDKKHNKMSMNEILLEIVAAISFIMLVVECFIVDSALTQVVVAISILALLYLGFRNIKVMNFRSDIISMAYDFDVSENFEEKRKMAKRITEKHSYNRMLFSTKPLKPIYWYDDDELYFLSCWEVKNKETEIKSQNNGQGNC